jgi:putative phosphoesterase
MRGICYASAMQESNSFSAAIAVVADTHDRLPPELLARLATAAEVWHLGDVCERVVLAQLAALGPPLLVVRGNNDAAHEWPLERVEERGGVRFQLIHIPPRSARRDVHVLLHGHTHVASDTTLHGVRWLNPGAVFRPRDRTEPSFAWLRAEAGLIDWRLERLRGAGS